MNLAVGAIEPDGRQIVLGSLLRLEPFDGSTVEESRSVTVPRDLRVIPQRVVAVHRRHDFGLAAGRGHPADLEVRLVLGLLATELEAAAANDGDLVGSR